jgi:hypothetical protein
MLLEPVGSCHRQGIKRGTQRFPHQIDPIEPTDPREHVGRIRTLASSASQPPLPLACFQQDV